MITLREKYKTNSHLNFSFNKYRLLKSKRSQSEVISTILLILLVIVAITIITAFAIPFVRNQLSKSDCLEVSGKVEIADNLQYTCYNSSNQKMLVQIKIGDIADKINGFSIEIGGASTENFEITNEYVKPSGRVSMYDGGGVEIPGNNAERTYIISNILEKPQIVKVYSILENGESCDSSDSLTLVENCFTP